ncbi:MAG TPA: phosphotransferase [Longimicrobium sp.]|nr:phosphotransferase [Longimicrobium sp.]
MILSSRTLVHYLVDRGLVPAQAVVDGDYTAREMSRRNRNFSVTAGAGPGLFVKQPGDWEAFSSETLRREATCYLLARDDPDFRALAEMMPPFVDWDAAHHVLTLQLLPASESLAEHHGRTGRFPPRVARRLGELLGSYHRHAGSRARDGARDAVFPRGLPWILNVRHHNPSHVGPVSAGNRALVEMLGRYPAFGPALDAVRDGWRRDALVHGDLKWENCLILQGDEEAPPELRIIDWELADFGDACWDVGSVFQAYLSSWILSIRDAGTAHPDSMAALATVPIEHMQPGINAFWRSYVSTLGLGSRAADERLRRSMLFAAARLIQTAWEHTAYLPHVPPNVLLMMQVAMNILTRADDAVRHLLGFQERVAA